MASASSSEIGLEKMVKKGKKWRENYFLFMYWIPARTTSIRSGSPTTAQIDGSRGAMSGWAAWLALAAAAAICLMFSGMTGQSGTRKNHYE